MSELLGVSDITVGDLFEGIIYIGRGLLVLPFRMSSSMLVARVGTSPLTAYSASLTLGLMSFQKKSLDLEAKEEVILNIFCIFDS